MAQLTRLNYGNWIIRLVKQFISDNEFARLLKASSILKYKKGETILKQGNQPIHIAFLQSGIVKFNFESDSNKNIILAIVAAPKILGGANLFYKDNNLFSIVALEECEVILIDSVVLLELLNQNGKFAVAIYQVASEMFKKAIMNFISLASKHKEGRIADILLYLFDHIYKRNSFVLPLKRKEMAEFACCSPENVIMTLSRWNDEGVICVSGRSIEIKDIGRLRNISKYG